VKLQFVRELDTRISNLKIMGSVEVSAFCSCIGGSPGATIVNKLEP
jgi:hypothetical protein